MFENIESTILTIGTVLAILYLAGSSINFIRQTERGLVERFGKYNRYAEPGLTITIPILERIEVVNVTERMVDATKQEIITKDKLNATVDAQIYFRVKPDEESVKNSVYNVNAVEAQTVALARTTLRNIIGDTTLTDANSGRDNINSTLLVALIKETKAWGIDILRTELKEIDPPETVQASMNQVVVAENRKTAAIDFALAAETEADGIKKAAIKKAEGVKEALILEATGKAEALTLVNNAVEETFTEKAQLLRKLETVETSLARNTKIVLPANSQLINVISDMAGTPLILDTQKQSGTKKQPEKK